MLRVLGVFFLLAFLLLNPLTVFAEGNEEKVVLTDREEALLRDFVASLTETPVGVELQATLHPPQTTYRTAYVEKDIENLRDRVFEIRGLPKEYSTGKNGDTKAKEKFFVQFGKPIEGDQFTSAIPCGSFEVKDDLDENGQHISDDKIGVWLHPNTGAKKCPHTEGTDHPGTIAVKGRYSLHLLYQHGLVTPVIKGTWEYTCNYTQGSKSGIVPCEVKLVKWEGRNGGMPTPEHTEAQKAQTNNPNIVILAAIGVVLAAGAYVFRRFHK